MATRRVFATFVLVAAVATGWLLFGRGDRHGKRADRQPIPAATVKTAATAPSDAGATAKGAPDAPARPAESGGSSAAPVRVRVVDSQGAAIVGATVEAYAHAGMGPYPLGARPLVTCTTGRDGRSVPVALGGSAACWVRAAHGGAATAPSLAWPGSEVTLVLEVARALRGVVLSPEGAPAAGLPIDLTFAHAGHVVRFGGLTDACGGFELAPLPDAWLERLVVEVREPCALPESRPARHEFCQWRFEFGREKLLAGTITLRLTVVQLHARVVSEEGTPVAHAMVHWAPPSAPAPPSFRFLAAADEDGRFDMAVQRLAGEAFVIRGNGYAPLVWRPDASSSDRKIHVPEITLRRGVPLSGRVSDPAGQPLFDAAVRLESPRLPGQVIDEAMSDPEGSFRFEAVADEEHVLYSFRHLEPDLCLPQLRMPGVRGGPDAVRIVLPEPIYGTVRFVAPGTGDALTVEHLTLIVKDARGAEVAKRTWEPSLALGQIRFEVWEERTYDLEVYTARQEPARVSGVDVVRGRGAEVSVPLVSRR